MHDLLILSQEDKEETVTSIVLSHPTVSPKELVSLVADKFLEDAHIDFFPVVKDGKVLGMVWRRSLMDLLAKRFGQAVYGKKQVRKIMDHSPVLVDVEESLVELSRKVTDGLAEVSAISAIEAFIVTKNDIYIGCVYFRDLLRKITDLKVDSAQYANPLSGLPGNVPIQRKIKQFLDKKVSFEVVYVDVDNFKSYNDFYSFEEGDGVIRLIASLLQEVVYDCKDDRKNKFIGHIGGDDFIIVSVGTNGSSSEEICKNLLDKFENKIVHFYTKQDQKSGGINGLDRKNKKQFFPIMSLSLGVVIIKPDIFNHTQQLSSLTTKAKKQAKKITGNSYYIIDMMELY